MKKPFALILAVVLLALCSQGDMEPAQIADHVMIPRQTITSILDKLAAADLVRAFEGLSHEYLFEWDRAPADSRPSAAKLEERLFAVLSKLLLA